MKALTLAALFATVPSNTIRMRRDRHQAAKLIPHQRVNEPINHHEPESAPIAAANLVS